MGGTAFRFRAIAVRVIDGFLRAQARLDGWM